MIRQAFKRLWNDKRGHALLIAGAAMPLVIGSAGLGADTIQWALRKRQLQRAADSAAIAGVYAKIQGQDVTTAVRLETSLTRGNTTQINLLNPVTPTFPINPAWTNGVAVTLQIQKRLNFSSMFMSSPPIIEASATAAAVATGCYSVTSLIATATTGISAGGTANVDLGNCGMITNSTALSAAVAFGSSTVKASPIAAVGGLDRTDNWAAGTTLLPFTIAQPDPYAAVTPPTIPTPCGGTARVNSSQTGTFPAGCYSGMDFKGDVTLGDGTYIITGNVDIGAQAHVTCLSCTIILTNNTPSNTGTVSITAGAQVDLKAQGTGDYPGILFYQNRGATAGTINKINGNSNSSFQGAFYFPNQEVVFNGTAGLTYNCMQLVALKVTFTGTSNITNVCPANSGVKPITGSHVRLVA